MPCHFKLENGDFLLMEDGNNLLLESLDHAVSARVLAGVSAPTTFTRSAPVVPSVATAAAGAAVLTATRSTVVRMDAGTAIRAIGGMSLPQAVTLVVGATIRSVAARAASIGATCSVAFHGYQAFQPRPGVVRGAAAEEVTADPLSFRIVASIATGGVERPVASFLITQPTTNGVSGEIG